MLFKQFYLGCLAHASYVIGSNGEAAVVDPRRDVDEYIAFAEAEGLTIRYVIETHLHADFVSGHRELAERTGATIVIGHRANAEFTHRGVQDGDRLMVGDVALEILETPGHTPESICILAGGEKLLTGDTLFIGDVGRPDLAGGAGFTPDQMASMLYDSLHRKLLQLDDQVEVYPAHGAGSLCGKNISKDTSSTIGQQRRFNYALQPMPKEAFVAMLTADLGAAPRYFAYDAQRNRAGARALSDIPRPRALTAEEVRTRATTILDVRDPDAFCAAHVPGSINIGLGGQYASWAGALLDPEQELVLVAENETQIDEAVMRLARVGLENAIGYLQGGIEAWTPLATTRLLSVQELEAMIDRVQFVDVRGSGEYLGAHAHGAANIPLDGLRAAASQLDRDRPLAVICAGGYRSTIAASILENLGFRDLFNVTGGTTAWRAAGLPTDLAA
jgi:glyoxylase-like metal-dependent hydrolase (beta-lactamase superfamily II)/rhodanese-related sulfurtransferase